MFRSARLLLYYVHLDQNSSNSQRKACLAAAQSISQSCSYAATLDPVIIPSYCLRKLFSFIVIATQQVVAELGDCFVLSTDSYFISAQVLLRFASVMDKANSELTAQLNQQIQAIS